MKYLIIDDEYMAHDIIKGYAGLLPNLQLMKSCFDAIEAIAYLQKDSVDLIFLDLNMPKLKGFEFLRTLRNPPAIIVTTAYREFALEGYELNIVDYLLKPFGFERFLKAINKVTGKANPVKLTKPVTPKVGSIFLRSNKKYIQVSITDILYLESAGNYTKVVTQGKTITVREKISDLLNSLPADDFLQVHKSFAVAIPQIESIEGNRLFIGQHIVPIGAMYKLNLIRLLG